MAKTVRGLDFPQTGFMESRRGTLVEVGLSNALTGARRTDVRVPAGPPIASERETFLPQEPPPEREGDQPVNPYGIGALDEQGRAFRFELDVDEDDAEEIWVEAATRYGKSLHPWHYVAAMTEDFDDEAEAVASGEALHERQPLEPVGDDLQCGTATSRVAAIRTSG